MIKTIWKKLKSTYFKAYTQIKDEYPNQPDIHLKAFANCVSLLCHDNIDLPLDVRSVYILKLGKLSGGPTIREHYCMWKAFGQGDSVRNMDNKFEMTQFQIDPRLAKPGTWTYTKAYDFCKEYIFAPLGAEHKFISKIEYCADDTPDDIKLLKELP